MNQDAVTPPEPGSSTDAAGAARHFTPYRDSQANRIYNLLFCDDRHGFSVQPGHTPTEWQRALFSQPIDVAGLEALAADPAQESRVRYLAFQRLREDDRAVVAKQLLGVIVEVGLPGGLDTLAAYGDGGVRYINQSGKIVVVDGMPAIEPLVVRLLAAATPVVEAIGPADEPRRAPPGVGDIRLTFLVSDGLYFGEGPFPVVQHEPLAAPVVEKATELLQAVVGLEG